MDIEVNSPFRPTPWSAESRDDFDALIRQLCIAGQDAVGVIDAIRQGIHPFVAKVGIEGKRRRFPDLCK